MLGAAHLTVYLFLSTGSDAQDGYEGVAGRNRREKCFPNEGLLICPPGKSVIFYKEATEKNVSVARPDTSAVTPSRISSLTALAFVAGPATTNVLRPEAGLLLEITFELSEKRELNSCSHQL